MPLSPTQQYRRDFFELFDPEDIFTPTGVNLDIVPSEIRRDGIFGPLITSGNLVPLSAEEVAVANRSPLADLANSLKRQADKFAKRFEAADEDILGRITDIRRGRITPESEGTVLSDRGVEALLDQRLEELEAFDRQNQEELLGRLSQRGLLGTGFSGPAAQEIFDERQRLVVDPFTQFGNTIRAQVEQQRAERNAQLQQEATALEQFRATGNAQFAQNLTPIAGSLLQTAEQLRQQQEQFNAEFLFNRQQQTLARRERDLAREDAGGFLGGLGGLIGGFGSLLSGGGFSGFGGGRTTGSSLRGNPVGTLIRSPITTSTPTPTLGKFSLENTNQVDATPFKINPFGSGVSFV